MTDEQKKEIGQQVKAAREISGLTQIQLAAKTGLRQATIADIENGKANCRLSTLSQIATALGCSLEVNFKK